MPFWLKLLLPFFVNRKREGVAHEHAIHRVGARFRNGPLLVVALRSIHRGVSVRSQSHLGVLAVVQLVV